MGVHPGSVEEKLDILVVEDDHVYAGFVANTLREAGHSVAIAQTGAAAREQARARPPHAVILDLMLPDANGYDVARGLREGILHEDAIIILLTANLYPERDLADSVGIDVVLSKPVEAELVLGMVDLVRARRGRRLRSQ